MFNQVDEGHLLFVLGLRIHQQLVLINLVVIRKVEDLLRKQGVPAFIKILIPILRIDIRRKIILRTALNLYFLFAIY